jgi:hypothetical protein
MPQILMPVIPKLTVTSAIDILAVAVLLYNFILILRGRRAMHVFTVCWRWWCVSGRGSWREWFAPQSAAGQRLRHRLWTEIKT